MIILVGTGGHSKVVFEALTGCGVDNFDIYPRNEQAEKSGALFMGRPIKSPEFPTQMNNTEFHIAIGNNKVRETLFLKALGLGGLSRTIVHMRADISTSSMLEGGCFVASGSVVAAAANVGEGTILNHNCVVDHDCQIGSYCHVAPGSILGGHVTLGDRVLIGSGAVVLPGLFIGDDAVVGAGSVVTKSIGKAQTWIGTSVV